jgi:glycosyltransferase involved in cell wall biosynthesis
MKIAMLTHDSASFGEHIRINAIADGLRRQGHDVDLLVMDRRKAARSLTPAVLPFAWTKVILLLRRLGAPGSRQMAKVYIKCVLSAFYLIPLLQRGAYAIILAETHYSGLCAWLMRAHIGARLYVDFHGTAEEVAAHQSFYRQALRLERLLVRECDFAISCSATMREHLIANHAGDPARHIICHNGSEPRPRVARYDLPLRVIFAGHFAYYQRVMDFVEAARLNTDPEIEFYLMGGGENEAEILNYIRRHGIRINWLGYRPREEALDLFTTMQVGVSPATTDIARRVASPLKILDYAACGLPVVTVAGAEWSEIFRDYAAGIVCNACSGESLLAAFRELKDPDRWASASQNAQQLIREARTWPVVLAPLYKHLRSLEATAAVERLPASLSTVRKGKPQANEHGGRAGAMWSRSSRE